MINFLFLMTTATASDVYEICVHEKQLWNDREQAWFSENTETFFTKEPIQFIVHKNSFEMNRDTRNIVKRETIENLPCFREHQNSFVCLDTINKKFLREFHKRNGEVTRDVLTYCIKNGEPA